LCFSGRGRSYAADFAIALDLLLKLQAPHLSEAIYDRYEELEIPNYIRQDR
jgi:hypothetical protein